MHDFIPLTVTTVRAETTDAVSIGFAIPPAGAEAFRFRPGQHLALRTMLDGEEVRRTYSICSGPDDRDLSIAVKRIPDGLFSNWACDRLRVGMTIESMPPAGRFVLPEAPGQKRHWLGFAAGAGITPIMAMIEHAMRRQSDSRFTLVYGNRDLDSIIFRERLEDLKDAFVDRVTLVHVLSRNEESEAPLLEGRISADKVRALSRHLFRVDDVDDVFICGPGSMIRDVRNTLFEIGFARDRVHHEFFAAGGGAYRTTPSTARAGATSEAPIAPPGTESEVVAILDGKRHRFSVRRGETIVDAALRNGVRAPYSCKGGMCSTCRARIVDGSADMLVNYSLEPWEIEKRFVLTCQAMPTTPTLVVDYDQM